MLIGIVLLHAHSVEPIRHLQLSTRSSLLSFPCCLPFFGLQIYSTFLLPSSLFHSLFHSLSTHLLLTFPYLDRSKCCAFPVNEIRNENLPLLFDSGHRHLKRQKGKDFCIFSRGQVQLLVATTRTISTSTKKSTSTNNSSSRGSANNGADKIPTTAKAKAEGTPLPTNNNNNNSSKLQHSSATSKIDPTSSSVSTKTPSVTAGASSNNSKSPGGGAYAGIGIGIIFVLGLVGLFIRRKMKGASQFNTRSTNFTTDSDEKHRWNNDGSPSHSPGMGSIASYSSQRVYSDSSPLIQPKESITYSNGSTVQSLFTTYSKPVPIEPPEMIHVRNSVHTSEIISFSEPVTYGDISLNSDLIKPPAQSEDIVDKSPAQTRFSIQWLKSQPLFNFAKNTSNDRHNSVKSNFSYPPPKLNSGSSNFPDSNDSCNYKRVSSQSYFLKVQDDAFKTIPLSEGAHIPPIPRIPPLFFGNEDSEDTMDSSINIQTSDSEINQTQDDIIRTSYVVPIDLKIAQNSETYKVPLNLGISPSRPASHPLDNLEEVLSQYNFTGNDSFIKNTVNQPASDSTSFSDSTSKRSSNNLERWSQPLSILSIPTTIDDNQDEDTLTQSNLTLKRVRILENTKPIKTSILLEKSKKGNGIHQSPGIIEGPNVDSQSSSKIKTEKTDSQVPYKINIENSGLANPNNQKTENIGYGNSDKIQKLQNVYRQSLDKKVLGNAELGNLNKTVSSENDEPKWKSDLRGSNKKSNLEDVQSQDKKDWVLNKPNGKVPKPLNELAQRVNNLPTSTPVTPTSPRLPPIRKPTNANGIVNAAIKKFEDVSNKPPPIKDNIPKRLSPIISLGINKNKTFDVPLHRDTSPSLKNDNGNQKQPLLVLPSTLVTSSYRSEFEEPSINLRQSPTEGNFDLRLERDSEPINSIPPNESPTTFISGQGPTTPDISIEADVSSGDFSPRNDKSAETTPSSSTSLSIGTESLPKSHRNPTLSLLSIYDYSVSENTDNDRSETASGYIGS
ncbi:hypothetical protein G9A89_014813 [Geosiphon pyriformis]|nr:hypothetical protein G9A89_014813 [Geosiphon pyriformis]